MRRWRWPWTRDCGHICCFDRSNRDHSHANPRGKCRYCRTEAARLRAQREENR